MSTTDDNPTSDDKPPPNLGISRDVKRVIRKLSDSYELRDYAFHIAAYHAQHLTDEAAGFRNRLLLQGLDEEDLFTIHEFLNIKFDGELMKMYDKNLTEQRAEMLGSFITK
ncbi:hypothetical protein ACFL3C_04705 [Patescibacteria group bacterium]